MGCVRVSQGETVYAVHFAKRGVQLFCDDRA